MCTIELSEISHAEKCFQASRSAYVRIATSIILMTMRRFQNTLVFFLCDLVAHESK